MTERLPDVVETMIAVMIDLSPRLAVEIQRITHAPMPETVVREAFKNITEEAERALRHEVGGQRPDYIAKKRHLSPEQREIVYQDGLKSEGAAETIAKHGISRRTLYRLMKQGPTTAR